MKTEILRRDDELYVRLMGDLSRGGCAESFTEIRRHFAERPADVLLDMSQVEFISSFALATVMRLRDHVRAQDKSFRLLNPSPQVRVILEKTGLGAHFEPGAPGMPPPPVPAATDAPGEAENASEFLEKEDSRSQEALDSVEAGMQAIRAEREKLGAKILTLESRVTALQARNADLERTRVEAVEQGAALAGKVEEMEQTLAQQAARLEVMQAAEEGLEEARRREEELAKRVADQEKCLEEIRDSVRRVLPDGLRMPSFSRNPLGREEATNGNGPPRGAFLTPP